MLTATPSRPTRTFMSRSYPAIITINANDEIETQGAALQQ
jgi:hypothetical protein